jgi:hypothetical protein
MSHNVKGIVVKHYGLNLISRLWKRISSCTILGEKFNEYMKLAYISMIQVLRFVEDEKTFSNVLFMKNKL